MLRLVIREVIVVSSRIEGQVWVQVNWQTGAHEQFCYQRRVHSYAVFTGTQALEQRVREQSVSGDDGCGDLLRHWSARDSKRLGLFTCSHMSVAEKPMEVCACCTEPACAVAAPVRGSEQCQWNGSATQKPRQVSMLLPPLAVGPAPLLWKDWSRRAHRRACMQLLRHQCVTIQVEPGITVAPDALSLPLSRASRAHARLTFAERLARVASLTTVTLFGVPDVVAKVVGLPIL
jgi:hypothetical protein